VTVMDRRSISMFLDEEGAYADNSSKYAWSSQRVFQLHLPIVLNLSVEKRQREKERERRHHARQDTMGSSTPPIPEEPEDDDSDAGYMSGQSPSPPESHQPPPAMHRQHAPPSSSNTRTSSGFRDPPVIWHHDGPALAVGGAQYPGTGCSCSCTSLLAHSLGHPSSAVQNQLAVIDHGS